MTAANRKNSDCALSTGVSAWTLPLDDRGIQRGVQEASKIRAQEITEDYPWVREVMDPLEGSLIVPCNTMDIVGLWKAADTVAKLVDRIQTDNAQQVKLPPQNIDKGPLGILLDLEALGMLQRITADRIQMPDVYRVAFGFGRRGGVKPLKSFRRVFKNAFPRLLLRGKKNGKN